MKNSLLFQVGIGPGIRAGQADENGMPCYLHNVFINPISSPCPATRAIIRRVTEMMHEPVLVLNANFEPLNVCNIRRAIGLMMTNKANLVLNGRGYIRTVSLKYPRPSVIRLERMIRRPRRKVKLSRREVLRRDNYTCQYCGQNGSHLTIDHVVPRSLGGEHIWSNLVAACPACNHRKGGRTIAQAHMHLLRIPTEPPASAGYLFARHLTQNEDWIPFIEGW